ncbi:hypothetical protein GCM10010517_48030 [Streptosporangium fragile]|uniref:Thioredoxin domain-containing protein n=1 Tax=Streptosporangium fragile TaxID=46186 RepID=A0ABN3W218_9ACTN
MPYLTAAVIVLGVLCGLNLMLTLAVIRRLKEHTRKLAELSGGGGGRLPAVGSAVGHFDALTVDGEAVSRHALEPGTVVGFFSPGCEPCRKSLPEFTEYARALPGGRNRVLAVVTGTDDSGDMTGALARVARVVAEGHGGPVTTAFGVGAFPTFCLLDDGHTVAAAGFELSALPDPIVA